MVILRLSWIVLQCCSESELLRCLSRMKGKIELYLVVVFVDLGL